MRRFRLLEELQAGIAEKINARYAGKTTEVLFEQRQGERWKGRTRTNKLVFLQAEGDLRGQILPVKIDWTGPWSMIAEPIQAPSPAPVQ
jgi:tRNA-2-methylthio-N6-dimethylallyladenosine synthase